LIFVVFAFFVALVVFYFGFALRYIYRYYLGPSGLEGRWLGIQTMFVPYANVEDVRVVPFSETLGYGMRTVRAGNCLGGPVVVVKQRLAFRETVLLTPENAEVFAGELRRRVEGCRR
jgi:hypothetical protein